MTMVDTDLPDLGLPNPAFSRRGRLGNSSNRSSMTSADLASLNSEELWALEMPDASNPSRQASERPLDTVRRLSKAVEHTPYHGGLPMEVICAFFFSYLSFCARQSMEVGSRAGPQAPPVMPDMLPARSQSYGNVAGLKHNGTRRGSAWRKGSGNQDIIAQSQPTSPIALRKSSSNHSSQTDLPLAKTKSATMLARPPSVFYSRDFMTTLGPREGGYAVAAQMAPPQAASRRQSMVERRAPMAKSAGMRWSLDGGNEFLGYGNSSAATTETNLSAYPTPDPSPPANLNEEAASYLPEGASPPANPSAASPTTAPADPIPPRLSDVQPVSSIPANPSPLSQQTHAKDIPPPSVAPVPVPPIPQAQAQRPELSPKKSKRELKQEAKQAEKAAAALVAKQRADKLREDALKKQQAKEAEQKAKDEAKRKEKEAKANKKAEEARRKVEEAQKRDQEAKHRAEDAKRRQEAARVKAEADAKARAEAQARVRATAPPPSRSAGLGPLKALNLPNFSNQSLPFLKSPTASTNGQSFPSATSPRSSADAPVPAPRQQRLSLPVDGVSMTALPNGSSSSQTQTQSQSPIQAPTAKAPQVSRRKSIFGTFKKKLSSMTDVPTLSRQTPPPVPPKPVSPPTVSAPAIPPSLSLPDSSSTGSMSDFTPSVSAPSSTLYTTPQLLGSDVPLPTATTEVLETPRSASGFPTDLPLSLAPTTLLGSKAVAIPAASDDSTPTPRPPSPRRAQSHGSPTSNVPSAYPPLSKTLSHDSSRSLAGSPASLRVKPPSLRGPRPMPGGGSSSRSRAPSIATSSLSDNHAHAIRLGHEAITPSTSGESSMLSQVLSHSGASEVVSSPFTSDDSRRSSEVGYGLGIGSDLNLKSSEEDKPARGDSEGSNETVHVDRQALAA